MIPFLQPLLSLLIGLALSLYGLVHSSHYYPGQANLYRLWQSLPALSSVIVFALGVAAVAIGLAMVMVAIQGLRKRYRQISHAYSEPRRHQYDEDDTYGAQGVYR